MYKNIWKHLKLITIHRWYVFIYCCMAGMPIRGLIHDLSKYSPTEFFESIKYYNGKRSPIDVCKEIKGYSKAWLHHKGRNPHHYEYWQDNFDNGGESLQMPFEYALEMICDYLAAGKVYMKKNFTYFREYKWWQEKTSKPIAMHPQTLLFVDLMLKKMAKTNSCRCIKKDIAHRIYYRAEKIYRYQNAQSKIRPILDK